MRRRFRHNQFACDGAIASVASAVRIRHAPGGGWNNRAAVALRPTNGLLRRVAVKYCERPGSGRFLVPCEDERA